MSVVEWNTSLSVGIYLIDKQHKLLIQRINDLSKAVDMREGVREIQKTLGFMIDYTDFHFSTEEKHMDEQDYPAKDFHKKQHNEFKGMLNTLVEDFEEDGASEVLSTSINRFLGNWLITHIQNVDTAFGKFLSKKGLENIQEI
ncbi:MAG: bacteriohemerythrin [Candidatus Thorarchaeota archaeon]|jgi:hemerythrin